ncbi:hypothetical protein BC834DRAFT_868736 [Gloeopeniophorella convolvens]|nr:hypothetical protein BC834DRAFT_868736 [Gloeopeniophorella convolvens]
MISLPTPLSLRDAHLTNVLLTLGYVLPLYFTKYTRLSFSKTAANGSRLKESSERWRDDPAVIKARVLSVSMSTVASLYLTHSLVVRGSAPVTHTWETTATYLGLSFRKSDLSALLVTPALYLGPLYGRYLADDLPFMKWVRNYVAVRRTHRALFHCSSDAFFV